MGNIYEQFSWSHNNHFEPAKSGDYIRFSNDETVSFHSVPIKESVQSGSSL